VIGTWHNHTQWSDGSASVGAMIDAAQRSGVTSLGVSDHLVLDPAGVRHVWSMDPAELGAYCSGVREADVPAGMQVLCGVEADYIPQTVAQTRQVLAAHDVDFIVASVHFVDGFPVDSEFAPWEVLTVEEREEVHRRYWQLIREMASARLGDIAAHLDLTKKFGFRWQSDLSAAVAAALDAIAESGMVVEVNTAGWHKPCAEAYPSKDILRGCRERNIPVTINADAHEPDHLLRDFDRARELLRSVGYRDQVFFTRGGREMQGI